MCRPLSVRSDERTSLRIKLGKAGSDGLLRLPDWRITCFFVARTHRHRGVANVALAGALGAIVRLGGGLVENYPEDTLGRKVSGSFLSTQQWRCSSNMAWSEIDKSVSTAR